MRVMVDNRWDWKGNNLQLCGKDTGYSVVPDPEWPGMWRVQSPYGSLSDMVNISRAKDAARAIADRTLRPR